MGRLDDVFEDVFQESADDVAENDERKVADDADFVKLEDALESSPESDPEE